MFSLYKLFNNMPNTNTKLSIVHPGVTLTQMTNHYHWSINWLVKIGIKLLFPSPQKASRSIVLGAFKSTEKNYWIGPKRFNIWGNPKKQKLKSYDEIEASKIFKIAEILYKNLEA